MEYIEELKQRYSSFDEIQSLVDNDVPEDLYMDYKSISTKDEAQKFDAKDAELLGTALSGFANVEGGILIWGIREEKPKGSSSKVPRFQQGILKTSQAAQKFKKFLEENTGRCAVPPPRGVVHLIVDNGEEGNKYQAVVLTCIPKGNSTPLQSLKDQKFYLRSGESFMPMPYPVLAGLFGKRPTPGLEMSISFKVTETVVDGTYFEGEIKLKNTGAVKIREPFICLNLINPKEQNFLEYTYYIIDWTPKGRNKDNWRKNFGSSCHASGEVYLVSQRSENLVQGEELVVPFYLKVKDVPSQGVNITLKISVGAEDMTVQEHTITFDDDFFQKVKVIWDDMNEFQNFPHMVSTLRSELVELFASKNTSF